MLYVRKYIWESLDLTGYVRRHDIAGYASLVMDTGQRIIWQSLPYETEEEAAQDLKQYIRSVEEERHAGEG